MKKLLFTLLVAFLALQANSKNYYVSSTLGADTNDGLTTSTPWKSITKVNSMSATITIGDSILFKCGDVFTEMLNIAKIGIASKPIVYASYGTGAKPIINTAVTVTGWTATAANPLIWEANYTGALTDFRYLTINGKIQQIGRYPDVTAANDGFLYHDQCWNSNKFRDAALNVTTRDWTGATCVVYATPYGINVLPVSRHVKDTIVFARNANYALYDGYGYFIQNHLATLTRQGEWFFNRTTKKIYLYSSTNPSLVKVQVSGTDHSVNFASTMASIVLKNLVFQHADSTAIPINSGSNILISNCEFRNSLNGVRCITSSNITVDKCSFYDIFNVSIASTAMSYNMIFTNNLIKRNALVPGLGNDGSSGGNNAISIYCSNANISYNRIDSCSYIGIRYEGYGNKINHNEISNFNMRQFDGAAIYSFGTWSAVSGMGNVYGNNIIEYNYLHDGIGYRTGTNSGDGFNRQPGIYCDNLTQNNIIRRNILYNTNGILFNNNTHHHTAIENTIYNSDAFENLHPGIAGIGGYDAGAFHTVTKNTLFNVSNSADYNPYTGYNVGRSVDTVPPYTNHGHRNTQNIVFSSKYYRHLPMSSDYSIKNFPQYFSKLDSNYYWQPFALDTMITALNDSGFTKTRKMVYGPVAWSKYEPNAVFKTAEVPFTYGIPGANLFASNSTFDTDLTGWTFDSENATNPCYWTSTGLDAGSVTLSLSSTTANKLPSVRLIHSIGSVSQGDVYLLKFSMKSNSNIATLHINTTSAMSTPKMYTVSTTRTEYVVPICFSQNLTSQSIYFTLHDKGKVIWLDNISLQKVPITQESPSTAMRFEVNSTNVAKQVDLGSVSYKDVFGTIYSGVITLEPHTSKILMKYNLPQGIFTPKGDVEKSQTISVFPTPNKGKQALRISLNSAENVKSTLRIVSIKGEQILQKKINLMFGQNTIEIPALNAGMYIVESITENGHSCFAKFIQ
jgi:hypothetical protein